MKHRSFSRALAASLVRVAFAGGLQASIDLHTNPKKFFEFPGPSDALARPCQVLSSRCQWLALAYFCKSDWSFASRAVVNPVRQE